MEIRTEDMARFLRAKNVDDACPACGERQWWFSGLGDNDTYLSIPYGSVSPKEELRGAIEISPYGRAIVTVGCANCGNLRLHDRFVIEGWLNAHPVLPTPGAEK